jgi:hypothetical protein
LAAGTSAELTYEARAIDEFGEEGESAVNVAVVEVQNGGRAVRVDSDPLPLLVALPAADDEPTLDAGPTFTLTVTYMLLSFLAVSVMVMSRRGQTMAAANGRSLFTIISLVSATLVLAFRTNLQSEGIGLLAAIAGYVLGRGVTERDERRAEEAEAQALVASAPGSGGVGVADAAGVSIPPQTGAVTSAGQRTASPKS